MDAAGNGTEIDRSVILMPMIVRYVIAAMAVMGLGMS
jgi:acyl-coenzyme A synthetase/AMP-(fatty) acid ligase